MNLESAAEFPVESSLSSINQSQHDSAADFPAEFDFLNHQKFRRTQLLIFLESAENQLLIPAEFPAEKIHNQQEISTGFI